MDGPRQDTPVDEEEDMVIIYNRVPKTASTSFTNIAYDLCAKNKYHVLHINTTKNNPVMSLQDQVNTTEGISVFWYSLTQILYVKGIKCFKGYVHRSQWILSLLGEGINYIFL